MKQAIILAAALGLLAAPALAQGAGGAGGAGGGGGGASSPGGLSQGTVSPAAQETARRPMRPARKMMKSRSKKKMMRRSRM
jgi:hypothetical protein